MSRNEENGLEATASDDRQDTGTPPDYYCPITMEVMDDPVVAADGHSYERSAIEQWFDEGHRTSPVTNIRLNHVGLVPNHRLRALIQEHIAKIPQLQSRSQQERDWSQAIRLRMNDLEESFEKQAEWLVQEKALRMQAERRVAELERQLEARHLSSSVSTAAVAQVIPMSLFATPPLTELLITQFLAHVAHGEQKEAEDLLKRYPGLVLKRETIIDYSGRKFTNITAFEYALWALDWHMWNMLLKYLPEADAKDQVSTQEALTENSGHGAHFDFSNLIDSLKGYVDNFDSWKASNNWNKIQKQWMGSVGVAQKMVPTHVANEYCRPDRCFKPTPDFEDHDLPRVLKKDDWNGNWWTARYNGKLLGEGHTDASPGWAIHRGWANNGPGPWEGGPPIGCITQPTAVADYKAISMLASVRHRQLKELKERLLSDKENTQRSAKQATLVPY